jgi:hypothetical protein
MGYFEVSTPGRQLYICDTCRSWSRNPDLLGNGDSGMPRADSLAWSICVVLMIAAPAKWIRDGIKNADFRVA